MILLVEDYHSYAEHVLERLEAEGKKVVHALDMHQAAEALKKHKFEFVITDFCFPGGDGDQVLVAARSAGIERVYLNSAMPSQSRMLPDYTGVLQKDDLRGLVARVLGKSIDMD